MVLKEVWAASDKCREDGGDGTPLVRRVVLPLEAKKKFSELLFRPRRFLRRYGQRAISIDKRVGGNTFWRKGGVVTKVLTSTHFR